MDVTLTGIFVCFRVWVPEELKTYGKNTEKIRKKYEVLLKINA